MIHRVPRSKDKEVSFISTLFIHNCSGEALESNFNIFVPGILTVSRNPVNVDDFKRFAKNKPNPECWGGDSDAAESLCDFVPDLPD
ncbi:hypothetical protein LIER_38670 [Lithospermum erythrorhizon]|uniref:Uncharacterized protein n=1 Tax=Lithospermum erythrorhizon TaxID=34254 RepID=A0AAV3Q7B4_LITER